MTTEEWAELHGETKADARPIRSEKTRCYICGALVDPRETTICEQAGCENAACEDCQTGDPAIVAERGIPTCGECSAR